MTRDQWRTAYREARKVMGLFRALSPLRERMGDRFSFSLFESCDHLVMRSTISSLDPLQLSRKYLSRGFNRMKYDRVRPRLPADRGVSA